MKDDTGKKSATATDELEQKKRLTRRTRVRSLVLGTLAASGAFQLNGWQAQAHGNRSSHSMTALRSDLFLPQDYITFRQELTAPEAEQTLLLSHLVRKLATLGSDDPDTITVQQEIDAIEDQLRLRQTSQQALEFIAQGDIDAAAAMIEGEGEPELVTYEYLWTITDLAYLGRNDSRLTDEHLAELAALCKRAMQYVDRAREMMAEENPSEMERGVLSRIAEIYHNIASYMVPDIGEPTSEGLELGHEAAFKAYEMRVQLDQPTETLIAAWTVANYEGLLGNRAEAESLHRDAIAMAESLNNPVQVAWNKFSLARLSNRNLSDPAFVAEIEEHLADAQPNDPVAALLRLEIEHARNQG